MKDLIKNLLKAQEDLAQHGPPLVSSCGLVPTSCKPNITAQKVADLIKDAKQLVKTIVMGMKTILWSLSNLKLPAGSQHIARPNSSGKGMNEEECAMISQFFEDGLDCFIMLYIDPTDEQQSTAPMTGDRKDLLDLFSSAFTVLEQHNFREVVGTQMERLFSHINQVNGLIVIAQHFLANSNVSKYFADILLSYVIGRLKILSENEKDSAVPLRLCKMLFGSVNLFPENEVVLRSHLRAIITNCLRLSTEVKDPSNYFYLLRALFKSIEGVKFEGLYKEFLPLLPELLNSLIRLQNGAHNQQLRELFVELCLTIPARLSSLLPNLHLLMEPLVVALKSQGELVALGLQTLESWIDQLNPEFLYSLISGSGMRTQLMLTLWAFVQPGAPTGPQALRILGKLGSRNRRFLSDPLPVTWDECSHSHLKIELCFDGDKMCSVPLDTAINQVAKMMMSPSKSGGFGSDDPHMKMQAHAFLHTSLLMLLNGEDCMTALSSYIDGRMPVSADESGGGFCLAGGTVAIDLEDDSHGAKKTKEHLAEEHSTLQLLIAALFTAAADPTLKVSRQANAAHLADEIARHFALLYMTCGSPPEAVNTGVLSHHMFLAALEEVMCSESKDVTEVAVQVLTTFTQTIVTMAGSKETASELSLIHI
eukprot:TRINITY_DN7583_c0_g1_i1.p1 TRINITY_DN7583_c0_g1~~TRINITY_DN7583_c0_g1_i1.p1  ORF type:complete len:650 (+),score=164.16 TRINITY_DN7583_c0_g1_i1:109-2058(+)